LPNLRTGLARDELGTAMYRASRSPTKTATVGPVAVTAAELAELFIADDALGPRVSPAGAALLLRLYAANAFELTDRGGGKQHPEDLQRYAAATPAELPVWLPTRTRSVSRSHVNRAAAKQPSQVQFTYAWLSRMFRERAESGPEPTKLTLCGIEVNRCCLPSEGDPSADVVSFSWVGRDGVGHQVEGLESTMRRTQTRRSIAEPSRQERSTGARSQAIVDHPVRSASAEHWPWAGPVGGRIVRHD